jgi:ferritin-like metal-binding protein YciE
MSLNDQLESYLSDAHAIEEQALVQLRAAPDIAGDAGLAEIFTRHLDETEEHEQMVRDRLEAHGAKPSTLKEALMKAGGAGFVLFAGSQPDTPGKLTAHAYSYEHLELASYELLEIVARRAGDEDTAMTARRIRDEEQAMAERLEAAFDTAVDASLRALEPDDLQEQVTKYLADAHALEKQAKKLLEKAADNGGTPELERIYSEHLGETSGHAALVERRLDELGSSPSRFKDAAMKLGGLNWSAFFKAQPDTPGKLAAFAYAFEHLEIAGYEELKRVAMRAGDTGTAEICDRILGEERAAARKVAGAFERAAEAALQAVA